MKKSDNSQHVIVA